MGSIPQKEIGAGLMLLMLGGCSLLPSVKSAELTFAGTDVMLRGIEQISTNVEYYDETAKAVKVKKARIDPPFWIVSEKFLNGQSAVLDPATPVVSSNLTRTK